MVWYIVWEIMIIWFIHGLSMVYLWFIYGLSMVYLWFIYGLSMVYLRDYLWFIYGLSMVYLWFIYGLSKGLSMVWYILWENDDYLVYLWFIYGLSMVCPWFVYDYWIDDDWVMMIGNELHRGPDGASPGSKQKLRGIDVQQRTYGEIICSHMSDMSDMSILFLWGYFT